MSDSHLAIYDERNTVNGLRLEYEDLLKIEKADYRRIKELRALNEDVNSKNLTKGQSMNFKDCRSEDQKKAFPLSKKEKAMKNSIAKPKVTVKAQES